MKKLLTVLSLFLCLTLLSCGGRKQLYATIDGIDVSAEYTSFHLTVTTLSAPSLFIEQYPDEYKIVSAYGKESVPHILNYIAETDLNTLNAAFLICCCYGILDLDGYLTDEPLANIDAHVRSLQKYVNGAE